MQEIFQKIKKIYIRITSLFKIKNNMLSAGKILKTFETKGLPSYGVKLDYLPNDKLIEQLTVRFNVEFAVMFTIEKAGYYLFVGTHNSVSVPVSEEEILLKHTHPRGTPHPSKADINWLLTVQRLGSPQKQSVILPIGKKRITFNKNTPFIS